MRTVLLASVAALMLLGCGGSDDPSVGSREASEATPAQTADPTTDGESAGDAAQPAADRVVAATRVVVIDAGAEPRVELAIVELGDHGLDLFVDHVTAGEVGGASHREERSATVALDVTLQPVDAGTLGARFEAAVADARGFTPPAVVEPWEWELTSNGELAEVALPDADGLRELLSVPELFLVVPAEPIGAGAAWTYTEAAGPPIEVRVERIDDDTITASLSMSSATDGVRIELQASGTWDRASLLAEEVDARLEVDFDSRTTRNGVEVPATGEIVVERRLRGAA